MIKLFWVTCIKPIHSFTVGQRYLARYSRSGDQIMVRNDKNQWGSVEHLGRMSIANGWFEKHFSIDEIFYIKNYDELKSLS